MVGKHNRVGQVGVQLAEERLVASLVTLPFELLESIFPDLTSEFGLTRVMEELCWVPVRHFSFYKFQDYDSELQMWNTLQALAHTCRRLRQFALSRLWRVVQVYNIHSLGKVRESLRTMPHLAAHIRNFGFDWRLCLDAETYDQYGAEYGTLLDIAFNDRGAMWNRARRELDGELEDMHHAPYFFSDEGTFKSPGPDGRGPDRRITDPQDLVACINEIFSKFTLSMNTLVWDSDVLPLPLEAFEALKKTTQLRKLHFALDYQREISGFVPFWEIASQLEELSIGAMTQYGEPEPTDYTKRGLKVDIVTADLEEMEGFQLHSHFDKLYDYECVFEGTALRTVITAARGGHLRRLVLEETLKPVLWKPFSIKSLLPYWVGIEDWALAWNEKCWNFKGEMLPEPRLAWIVAAVSLRPALAHLSRVVAERTNREANTASQRVLTCSDVQAIYSEVQRSSLPMLDSTPEFYGTAIAQGGSLEPDTPFELYLRWLRDDVELAQQVADAWNKVVEAGRTGRAHCHCQSCYTPPRRTRYEWGDSEVPDGPGDCSDDDGYDDFDHYDHSDRYGHDDDDDDDVDEYGDE